MMKKRTHDDVEGYRRQREAVRRVWPARGFSIRGHYRDIYLKTVNIFMPPIEIEWILKEYQVSI